MKSFERNWLILWLFGFNIFNKDVFCVYIIYVCMGNKELREFGNYFVYLLVLFYSLIDIDVIWYNIVWMLNILVLMLRLFDVIEFNIKIIYGFNMI